ncbi:MAG: (2Fe-2S) ferredoxin domain-containing protein [Bacillaceae bacterium]|nr:(2Fe-2S) ferredoxin domain-containing protein [Bacillaceae bacterium]
MATWDLSETRHHVLICNGNSCLRKGGEAVTQAIREEISKQGADHVIHTSRTRCNGRCRDACVVIVYPEGTWYKDVTPEDAASLVQNHLLKGQPLAEKVSHRYNQHAFQRTEHTVEGTVKSVVK